jgi:chromosome segregation ATPase
MNFNEEEQSFNETMQHNELLAKENRLFDSYLHRKAGDVNFNELARELNNRVGGRAHLRRQGDRGLSEYDKYNIAMQEHEYRSKQLKALEDKAAEDISLLKAIIEGIKIRINEMRKETYEFKRDIVIGGQNQRTGHIMAEKTIRYFEEKIKQKAALVEKIKLKNAAMKNHRFKMDAQVKHKEEQGDSLHAIDFHQLQIKNSQFNQKINERNAELLKLKMTTGKTVQVLNTAKRQLTDLLGEGKRIRKELNDRKESMVKLSEELERVMVEVRKEKKKNKKFKIQQSNPDMPQVMDYVNQKSDQYELEAQVRNWKRKVEIVEMAARQHRAFLKAAKEGGMEETRPLSGPNRLQTGRPATLKAGRMGTMDLSNSRIGITTNTLPRV